VKIDDGATSFIRPVGILVQHDFDLPRAKLLLFSALGAPERLQFSKPKQDVDLLVFQTEKEGELVAAEEKRKPMRVQQSFLFRTHNKRFARHKS
jgi:hypothetical protein